MGRIFLDPGSVRIAGGTLKDSSGRTLAAMKTTGTALLDTGGLPPEFKGRAKELATRVVVKSGRMADVSAAMGLECITRAGLAEQQQGILPAGKLGPLGKLPGNLAASRKINFWNPKTAASATRHPGSIAQQVHDIEHPLKKASGRPKAGTIKAYADAPEIKKQFSIEISQTLKDIASGDKTLAEKAFAKHPELRGMTPEMLEKLKDAAKRGEITVEAGGKITIETAAGVKIALGNNWDVSGEIKASGEAGVNGKVTVSATEVSASGGAGAVVKVEGTGSLGNDQVRGKGTIGAEAGLELKGAADAGVHDGKVKASIDISVAAGIGIHVKGSVEIDPGKIIASLTHPHHDPPPPPQAVGVQQGPDGALAIGKG